MLQLASDFSSIYTDICGPFSVVVAAMAYFNFGKKILAKGNGVVPLMMLFVMLILFAAYIVTLTGVFSSHLTLVEDRTFVHDRVELGGYHYKHCRFVQVTFVLDGQGSALLEDSIVEGPVTFTTDTVQAKSVLERLNMFGALRFPYTINGKYVAPFGPDTIINGMPFHAPVGPDFSPPK